jgi:NADH-quinone oxidoreductase subunit H
MLFNIPFFHTYCFIFVTHSLAFKGFLGAFFVVLAYVLTMVLLIITIAFFTVLERKVLAAIQRRCGPNMSSLWGLLQAFADGIKLLLKESLIVNGANFFIFIIAPTILLTMSLSVWAFMPLPGSVYTVSSNYSFLILFLFTGLNAFAIVLSGQSSNSRYSLMGGVRAIAQVISYELPMSISLLTLATLQNSYDLFNFYCSSIVFAFLAYPAVAVFFICLLAETNRTPFDLPEAEAELVAGYNLEYSAILFSLFFLAEYSNMIVASCLMALIVCSSYFYLTTIFFCLWMILIRSSLPRYTFRQLISLSWKGLFPLSIFWYTFTVAVLFYLDSFAGSTLDPVLIQVTDEIISNSNPARILNDITPAVADSASSAGSDSSIKISGGFAFPKAIIFFLIALFISSLLVGFNWIIVWIRHNSRKHSPYECGFEPQGAPVANFEPNFTAVAIAFLIYDVEILLTYPFAIGLRGQPYCALFIFFLFIIFLLLTYAYEVIDGAFDI